MKRILSFILVGISLLIGAIPAWAETPTPGITTEEAGQKHGYDGFDVQEIFSVSGMGDNGPSENLTKNLIEEGEKSGSIVEAVILRAINILMLFLGTVAMILLMAGGLTWILAGGEEGRIDRGKAIITQTVLGMVIALLSYAIVSFVVSFFFQ